MVTNGERDEFRAQKTKSSGFRWGTQCIAVESTAATTTQSKRGKKPPRKKDKNTSRAGKRSSILVGEWKTTYAKVCLRI